MLINIKTSEANQKIIRELTPKLLGEGSKMNLIARIALGYSLQQGKKFTTDSLDSYDSKGQEYKDHVLFDAHYRDLYIAMICQHYGIDKKDDKLPKYIKSHIDHGLELLGKLFTTNSNYSFFDFLTDHIEKGLQYLELDNPNFSMARNNNQNIEKSYFAAPIKIQVGKTIDSATPIIFNFNNTTQYNNSHIAVAGSSGTGKTQFALDILRQIYTNSNAQTHFIYLDFKGLKQDDIKYYQNFFDNTQTTFIDVPNKPFPLNPLSFIDNINETNKQMGIDKFVDIVLKYAPQLGAKQRMLLRKATQEAFIMKKNGEYPDISEIYKKLTEELGDNFKPDTLTEIIEGLSRYKVFQEDKKDTKNFLSKNVYLSLSGDLPNSLRFTSLFLIVNYIYNVFANMDNTVVENDIRPMRYVVLIDEAHVIFKEKKYQDILEKMLRELRSKGVSIILLSQGIDEFNQTSFDFSSECAISFLLEIKDKNNTKAISKFLGLGEKDIVKAARSLEKIQKGQAIANIKEFDKCSLFEITQFRNT
jgi:DNA sulfur modification protein DndE